MKHEISLPHMFLSLFLYRSKVNNIDKVQNEGGELPGRKTRLNISETCINPQMNYDLVG
jgi:hypothetical protein